MKFIEAFAIAAALVFLSTPADAEGFGTKGPAQLYDTYCAQCHGLDRNGKGINTVGLSVQPRDHTDAKAMGDVPDDQMFLAIQKGGLAVNKSILMPAWDSVLTTEEIASLVTYLREVCNCGKK